MDAEAARRGAGSTLNRTELSWGWTARPGPSDQRDRPRARSSADAAAARRAGFHPSALRSHDQAGHTLAEIDDDTVTVRAVPGMVCASGKSKLEVHEAT